VPGLLACSRNTSARPDATALLYARGRLAATGSVRVALRGQRAGARGLVDEDDGVVEPREDVEDGHRPLVHEAGGGVGDRVRRGEPIVHGAAPGERAQIEDEQRRAGAREGDAGVVLGRLAERVLGEAVRGPGEVDRLERALAEQEAEVDVGLLVALAQVA